MSVIKQTLKKALPEPALNALRNIWDGAGRLQSWPAATFHPLRRESMRKLRAFKDIHKGERCFIIGNGPSLKNTDLGKLKGEYTFGMNRFFLAFPELGFQTSYFICVNDLVIEQTAGEFNKLQIPFFASWRAHRWLTPAENTHFLYTTYTGPKFAKDITGRIWEGATVTYSTLQLAYYMGFAQVILIGVDHNFQSKGAPNTTVVSQGEDRDHFHPGYFGKGFKWQLPDLETSERSYRLAKKTYEEDGREVLDATVGGKLTVFRKIPYESLFTS
jgi:hypothetical protein